MNSRSDLVRDLPFFVSVFFGCNYTLFPASFVLGYGVKRNGSVAGRTGVVCCVVVVERKIKKVSKKNKPFDGNRDVASWVRGNTPPTP
jgi:hypothetical protein